MVDAVLQENKNRKRGTRRKPLKPHKITKKTKTIENNSNGVTYVYELRSFNGAIPPLVPFVYQSKEHD